jgi:hypothetical protein
MGVVMPGRFRQQKQRYALMIDVLSYVAIFGTVLAMIAVPVLFSWFGLSLLMATCALTSLGATMRQQAVKQLGLSVVMTSLLAGAGGVAIGIAAVSLGIFTTGAVGAMMMSGAGFVPPGAGMALVVICSTAGVVAAIGVGAYLSSLLNWASRSILGDIEGSLVPVAYESAAEQDENYSNGNTSGINSALKPLVHSTRSSNETTTLEASSNMTFAPTNPNLGTGNNSTAAAVNESKDHVYQSPTPR